MIGYAYQFCSRKGDKYYDGIIQVAQKVVGYDSYEKVKKYLAKEMNIDDYTEITIISFSYLGEVIQ